MKVYKSIFNYFELGSCDGTKPHCRVPRLVSASQVNVVNSCYSLFSITTASIVGRLFDSIIVITLMNTHNKRTIFFLPPLIMSNITMYYITKTNKHKYSVQYNNLYVNKNNNQWSWGMGCVCTRSA